MDWLTANEALALLGTQPQTLYANVSRGRIKARRDPADSRKSLYRGDDVRRLAQRGAGRRKQEAVATGAMHWGEPVLRTAISTVVNGSLLYRGWDACELAGKATLEDVASLLWQAPVRLPTTASVAGEPGLATAFAALAARAAQPVAMARSPAVLADEAGMVLTTLAGALTGGASGPLHLRLAQRWDLPEAADAIRRALVLLADHELNASTFAARVTVSTGSSLWAGALSGLATLSGPGHGQASRAIAALVDDINHAPEPADTQRHGRAIRPGLRGKREELVLERARSGARSVSPLGFGPLEATSPRVRTRCPSRARANREHSAASFRDLLGRCAARLAHAQCGLYW